MHAINRLAEWMARFLPYGGRGGAAATRPLGVHTRAATFVDAGPGLSGEVAEMVGLCGREPDHYHIAREPLPRGTGPIKMTEWTKDIVMRVWRSSDGHVIPFEAWQGPLHNYGPVMAHIDSSTGRREVTHRFRLDGVYANCVSCGAAKTAVKCSYCHTHSTL